jgi:hypothetical protein
MYTRKPIEQILGSEALFSGVHKVYGQLAVKKLRAASLHLHVVDDTEIDYRINPELNNFIHIEAKRGAIKGYECNAMMLRSNRECMVYIPVDKQTSLRIEIRTIDTVLP